MLFKQFNYLNGHNTATFNTFNHGPSVIYKLLDLFTVFAVR